MANHGLPEPHIKKGQADGLTVAVITAQWNPEITDVLHSHALETATELGAVARGWRVAGAMELPVLSAKALQEFDVVVAGACVIKGETSHFDYVCQSVTDGLTRVALDAGKPVGNAVLTVNSMEQAIARIGGEGLIEDKGRDATLAALQSALLLPTIEL